MHHTILEPKVKVEKFHCAQGHEGLNFISRAVTSTFDLKITFMDSKVRLHLHIYCAQV